MIASVLPGLRELRVPLAAGYVWLITGWLLLHNQIRRGPAAPGAVDALTDLRDAIGLGGIAAAATFVAYLLGALWRPLSAYITEGLWSVRSEFRWWRVRWNGLGDSWYAWTDRLLGRLAGEKAHETAPDRAWAQDHYQSLADRVEYGYIFDAEQLDEFRRTIGPAITPDNVRMSLRGWKRLWLLGQRLSAEVEDALPASLTSWLGPVSDDTGSSRAKLEPSLIRYLDADKALYRPLRARPGATIAALLSLLLLGLVNFLMIGDFLNIEVPLHGWPYVLVVAGIWAVLLMLQGSVWFDRRRERPMLVKPNGDREALRAEFKEAERELVSLAVGSSRDSWWLQEAREFATDLPPWELFLRLLTLHVNAILAFEKTPNDKFKARVVGDSEVTMQLYADLPGIARRLVGEQQEAYLETSRMKGEVEFRHALAIPIPIAISVIVFGLGSPTSVWIATTAAGILAGVALMLDGWRLDAERNDDLVELLAIGKVKSPTFERLLERARRVSGRPSAPLDEAAASEVMAETAQEPPEAAHEVHRG
jgi:hypothetical protein